MREAESAASFAIALAKSRRLEEVTPDELLLGCLQAVAQFGIVQLGALILDLEELGIDWLQTPEKSGTKVAYSQAVVDIFDYAAQIAKAEGAGRVRVDHMLAAFAREESGLIGDLKRKHGITSANWRAAIAQLRSERPGAAPEEGRDGHTGPSAIRDYLSPEEAAAALGIHVQTVRGYVRAGKLPALRLAGERAIRIRRADLESVLEPLVPQTEPIMGGKEP
jgi:excisionase family DNA binding protein